MHAVLKFTHKLFIPQPTGKFTG